MHKLKQASLVFILPQTHILNIPTQEGPLTQL